MSGNLTLRYGFTDKDVGVYLFLFTRKVFSEQSRFNSYRISQELNKITTEQMLGDDNISYGGKAVSESLQKLSSLGFIRNYSEIDKANLKGAPPKVEYEARNLSDVTEDMRKKLDESRSKKLDLLSDLAEIEENVGLGNSMTKENKNGK